MIEIFVGGKSACGSGAALEHRGGEVTRLGIDPLRILSQSVAIGAVAPYAKLTIVLFPAAAWPVRSTMRLSCAALTPAAANTRTPTVAIKRRCDACSVMMSPQPQKAKSSANSNERLHTAVAGESGGSPDPRPLNGTAPMVFAIENSECTARPARLVIIGYQRNPKM